MKLKYFAWIKDITNIDEEVINDIKVDNLDKLKKLIIHKYPELKKHNEKEILRFAVNKEYVLNNINLKMEDEVAIFPPVSGG